jgi:hypothetical protein
MSQSMDMIAGTGLDEKTRKSRWPARLDVIPTQIAFLRRKMIGVGWK